MYYYINSSGLCRQRYIRFTQLHLGSPSLLNLHGQVLWSKPVTMDDFLLVSQYIWEKSGLAISTFFSTVRIHLSASHTGLTTMLRPSCDLKMLESWANSRLIARMVAEVLGNRGWSWVIVRANQSQQTVQKLLRWDFKSQRSHTSGT